MTPLGLALAAPHLSILGHRSPAAPRPRSGVARAPPQSHRCRRMPQLSVQPRAQQTGSHAARRGGAGVLERDDKQEVRATAIREWLLSAEAPPPSAYDTAWVAMVPAPAGSTPAPRYPQCVDWILRNQRHGDDDGSWGPGGDPSLRKDPLSSTLACVLALTTWGAGGDAVARGLRFIGRNWSCVTDGSCDAPAGFDVIFPGMVARAIGMGLEIPLVSQADVDAVLRLRDSELICMAASGSGQAFMAYVAEGLGDVLDWDEAAAAYQRKNGSFFDSPATTAAAAIHSHNDRALDYLDSVVSKFGSTVPTVYPRSAYYQLRMVDTLEKMGISRSFLPEINTTLDMIYRSWLANDEEIMLDMATCAMAFRLLRLHGYNISSAKRRADGLSQFSSESSFHGSIQGHLNDTEALLELLKASHVQITDDELILESIGSWSTELLKEQLRSGKTSRHVDPAEVEHVLKFPFHSNVDRLEHRWNIEHFKKQGFQMLKSAYRSCHPDEEILSLAVDAFHSSQAAYQEELQCVERWAKEMRLDELDYARVMPLTCLFPSASTMFPTEMSEARIVAAKTNILATIVDDLFDVREWDAYEQVGFCSERVEIVFRAVYDTSNDLAARAAAVQNRSVIHHIAERWAEMARVMMVEAGWRMSGRAAPSMEEYMAVAEPSFGLGTTVLTFLFFVGPELREDVVRGAEYGELFRRMNICGRLLNDIQSCEREKRQGKINSVLLLARHHGGSVEAAKAEVRRVIAASRRELLRMLVREGGEVPWPCRREFWNISKVVHLFYMEVDGYASPKEMMRAANEVVFEPLRIARK
ncbi:ent-kaur-16-ene synthase, chloroplastic-like [Panicum miliaceum]|uniref:Ent-kaur-16-ene synthase, chloroplastic-like n=1 Tax=Panicum miliaceum TaxID=4540 RepID=A0A3L6T160_PANMI|nr:ent-kaur-16-ene synthase, chloroplastic-like [Panicum miliaceum]